MAQRRSNRRSSSPFQRPRTGATRETGQADIPADTERETEENTIAETQDDDDARAFGSAQEQLNDSDAIEEESDEVVEVSSEQQEHDDMHETVEQVESPDARDGGANGGADEQENKNNTVEHEGNEAMKGITEALTALSTSMNAFTVSMKAAIEEQGRREAGRAKQVQQQLTTLKKAVQSNPGGGGSGTNSGDRGAGDRGAQAPGNQGHVTNKVTMSEVPSSLNLHHDAFAHLSNGDARVHQWSSQLVKSNTLKPTKPPPFDGDTGKADVFLWANQMDVYIRAFDNPTQLQIFQAVLANLSGAAARWAWDRVRVLRASDFTDAMPWDSIQALYADMAAVFHRSDNLTLAYSDYMNFSVNGFETATALRNHIVKVRLDSRTPSGMFAQHLMYTAINPGQRSSKARSSSNTSRAKIIPPTC